MQELHHKKIIAWGTSKLLEFYQDYSKKESIAYVVDSSAARQGTSFNGLEVKAPAALAQEDRTKVAIVIFAVSTKSIQAILAALNQLGFLLNINVFLYSDLFFDDFNAKTQSVLGRALSLEKYAFIKSLSLTSKIPIHTTLLGNLLFLELLDTLIQKNDPAIHVAEVGAFNCGNALISSLFMSQKALQLPMYLFDSFEGFPQISAFDPQDKNAGHYNIESTFEYIQDNFSVFKNVQIIKGFVPDTLAPLDPHKRYGLVFFDCDLYQPALDTYNYFWDKLIPGGFLLIHDYFAERGGFVGVRKATDEFFGPRGIKIHEFWETTMGLAVKP